MTQQTAELVITRTFDAPRALVWAAHVEADRLARWWGPKGTQLEIVRHDARPGGEFVYANAMPDGAKMYGKFAYQEVSAPERLVFISAFSDADGNVVRAPFSAQWPLEVKNVLTFTEENGRTTLTMTGGPYNATDEERAFFAQMLPNVQGGFKGTLDQLEAYLASAKA